MSTSTFVTRLRTALYEGRATSETVIVSSRDLKQLLADHQRLDRIVREQYAIEHPEEQTHG